MQQQQEETDLDELQQQPQAMATADTLVTQHGPHECGVCLFVYDEQDRRPCCLPCGHTYCSFCLSVLQNGHVICPSCRTNHCVPEANHFPFNYALEAVMKVTRPRQVNAGSQTTEEIPQVTPKGAQATELKTKRRATAGLSRKLHSMITEQGLSLRKMDKAVEEELGQLKKYRAKLLLSQAKHSLMMQELDKLVQQHQSNIDLLQEEKVLVEGFVKEGEEVQRELRAAHSQLAMVNTGQEAITTIDAADQTIAEAEEWLQHGTEEIPNGTVLSTSFTVIKTTKAALEVITKETKALLNNATSGHPNCSILEAVESIEGGPVELCDLRTERLKKKVKTGLVFALQKYKDGTSYSSLVFCEKDYMILQSLKNESPPPGAFILQVSKALEKLNYPSTSVFLDLAWPGTIAAKRIIIQLNADTPLTRQFVAFCLGHTGLTFCNARLMNVDRYNNWQIVWSEDISGHRAAADQVFPPINCSQCNPVNINGGMVVARSDSDSPSVRTTQFGIVMNHFGGMYGGGYFNGRSYYQLGTVVSQGLSIVQEVTKNRNITDVRVVNCGIKIVC